MNTKQLKEILDYTRKGATLSMIAKNYWKIDKNLPKGTGISLRTITRRVQPYLDKLEEERRIYKEVVLPNMFK